MFGDIAHGAMILALGIYLIMNNDMLSKGSFKLFSEMRYMITMMGFFATYCGFIYNDMAGFNMNFFTSCFNPPFHPGEKDNKISIPVHSLPGCVYPFGIDPVWGRA
jgi:V-type H+-transporting ATPase subunit a